MNPDTTVIGAKRVVERDPKTGKVVRDDWEPGKVDTYTQHWANAAAKKRCGGDFTLARPGEVKIVPLYRGIPTRFANEVRGDIMRRARIKHSVYTALAQSVGLDAEVVLSKESA